MNSLTKSTWTAMAMKPTKKKARRRDTLLIWHEQSLYQLAEVVIIIPGDLFNFMFLIAFFDRQEKMVDIQTLK
jgi:hypothetical protein